MADSKIDKSVWLVSRYKNRIKKGDIGLIWMAGKDAGIYAVVDITSDPIVIKASKQSDKYWVNEEDRGKKILRVRYKYKIKYFNNYISREELKNIPSLANLSIFRQPQATNFEVKNKEWLLILNLIKRRN